MEPIAQALGIRVELAEDLPCLSGQIQDFLREAMGSDDDWDDDGNEDIIDPENMDPEEYLAFVVSMVLEMPKSMAKQMPADLREELLSLADGKAFPTEMARKIKNKLR